MAARLRKGDLVVVISGKDKGKQGKVARLLDEDGKVVVEGLNMIKRHTRPNPKNQEGGIVEREAPMFASKVMPVDPETGKATRVRAGKDEKGNKVRVAVKSGKPLAAPVTDKKSEAKAE
jgi:large subunit ribosomal protein L24